jgi:16S rRNA (adenine1518-N6/adenine1519-N6)-dimethyltransferase
VHGLTFFCGGIISIQELTSIASLKRTLKRLGLGPAKIRGQHFLVRQSVLQRIVEASDLDPDDCVIEIGPGLGVLTRELASRVRRVLAVEVDEVLVATLKREFANLPNVTVLHADARNLDIESVLGEESKYKVVANLPYYAANPIIRRFLETTRKPDSLVVMLQREVAKVMVAVPGSMSLLSVAVQFYGSPSIVITVPPASFHPVPKVTSAVVHIRVYPRTELPFDDTEAFFRLVRAGFSAPRKQLRNSLAVGLGASSYESEEVLVKAGIDHRRRAETLSLDEWSALHMANRLD